MKPTFAARAKKYALATAAAAVLGAAAVGMAGNANATLYGDPEAAADYWQHQTLDDCALMSVADVVGQLTDDLPSELEIIGLAMITPSANHPGSIYIPPFNDLEDPNAGNGTNPDDIIVMLDKYDIQGVPTDDGLVATDPDAPATGLDALGDYLAEGHKIIALVNAETIWDVDGQRDKADHALGVTGVDTTKGLVHLNDSGDPDGQNSQVSIDTFEAAWETSDHGMVVTVETS